MSVTQEEHRLGRLCSSPHVLGVVLSVRKDVPTPAFARAVRGLSPAGAWGGLETTQEIYVFSPREGLCGKSRVSLVCAHS